MKRLLLAVSIFLLAGGVLAQESVVINSFGALPSSADAKAAIQKAIATGKIVRCVPGSTYTTDGGITVSTAGQVIDFTGCTVKLKNSATTQGILTVTGARARVVGGTWDLNKANNASGDQYGHFAVNLQGDGSSAEAMYVKDSHGLGIKGSANVNNATITRNRIEGCKLHGIYVEAITASAEGNKIFDNYVDGTVMEDTAVGIYLTGLHTSGFYQRRWNVSRNVVEATADVTGITVVGITVRGIEGVYHGNQVTGGEIQHSLDICQRCTVTGNRSTDPGTGGTTTYGLEVNGSLNTISNNFVKGTNRGIANTGQDADNNVYSGNVLEEITETGIYIAPGGSDTASNQVIMGNTITFTTGTARVGVRLTGTSTGSLVQGNVITGPGSAQVNGRGVFLDTPTAAARVAVIGNSISGMERAFTAFSSGALTVTDLTAAANDLSNDVAQSIAGWISEGSATLGARVTNMWPQTSVGGYDHTMDRAANVFMKWSDAFSSPEGNVTGGLGSIYTVRISNRNPMLWLKENGTGNTGWRGVVTNAVSADKGNAAATLTPGTSEHTNIWNTPISADRAVTLTTAAVQNGARFRIVRTAAATGAFNLNVGTGPLKALAVGQWCDVEFDGTAWVLTAFGSL